MRRHNLLTYALPVVALAGLAGIASYGVQPAAAASLGAFAAVTIESPITITAVTALNFGTIAAPSTGTQTFTITPGSDTVAAGAGDGASLGGGADGDYTVTGFGAANDIDIAATDTTACTGGVGGPPDLNTMTAVPDPVVTNGATTVNVGGNLDVPSGTTGTWACGYDVTANY